MSALYAVIGSIMIVFAAAGMVVATVFLVHIATGGGTWNLLIFPIAGLGFSVVAARFAEVFLFKD